jgi:hypothetical protein
VHHESQNHAAYVRVESVPEPARSAASPRNLSQQHFITARLRDDNRLVFAGRTRQLPRYSVIYFAWGCFKEFLEVIARFNRNEL